VEEWDVTVVEKEIKVRTPDGDMTTFVVRPEGAGPFPVAVVYQDGLGYREQVKDNARRFAAAGFYCVVPDLFYRSGERIAFDFSKLAGGLSGPDAEQVRNVVAQVTPDRVVADTKAIFATIASDPAAGSGPKVCVGYCMGARVSLHAASALHDDFVAAAGIHPGALVNDNPDSPHHDVAAVRGELYFSFAEMDRTATPELIDRLREELQRKGVRGVVERLPGTTHGFAMADLPVYNHDAAERHFAKTIELWRRNLPN
jgi:carboxymethylenebutenolidase